MSLHNCSRRVLCQALGAAALVSALPLPAASKEANTDPRRHPPQMGDELVTINDDGDAEIISADSLKLHAAPLTAYPRDPANDTVRDRSRLNQILLLRLKEDELDQATSAHAANGIVAYSGICTHAACGVSSWDAKTLRLVCPCHASQYDPRQGAKRVAGPAPRALPSLPIKIVDKKIIVAGVFSAPVGAINP